MSSATSIGNFVITHFSTMGPILRSFAICIPPGKSKTVPSANSARTIASDSYLLHCSIDLTISITNVGADDDKFADVEEEDEYM